MSGRTLHGIRKRPGVRERLRALMRRPEAREVVAAPEEEPVPDLGWGRYVLLRRPEPKPGCWGAEEFSGIEYDICKINKPGGRTAGRGKPFGDALGLKPQPDQYGRWDLSVWLGSGPGKIHTTYHRLIGLSLLECQKGTRGQAVQPFKVPVAEWDRFEVLHRNPWEPFSSKYPSFLRLIRAN